MLVAALKSSGQSVTFEEGRGLFIAGEPFDLLRLVEADRAGDVEWAGPDIRDWAYESAQSTPRSSTPGRRSSRGSSAAPSGPVALKVLVAVLFGFSVLYTATAVVQVLRGAFQLPAAIVGCLLLWLGTWFAAKRQILTRDVDGGVVGLFGLSRKQMAALTAFALVAGALMLANVWSATDPSRPVASASAIEGSWVDGKMRLNVSDGRYTMEIPVLGSQEVGAVEVRGSTATFVADEGETRIFGGSPSSPLSFDFVVSEGTMTFRQSGVQGAPVWNWVKQ